MMKKRSPMCEDSAYYAYCMLNKNHMIIGKGAEKMSEPLIYYVVYLFYFLLMSRDLMRNVVSGFAT